MSRNFSANQYESGFLPRSLQNWEVPRFPCKKVSSRIGKTEIIANTRGHLLPGVPRPNSSPWGEFQGTWDLPRRITRTRAESLNGIATAKIHLLKCQPHSVYPPHFILHKSSDKRKATDQTETQQESQKTEVRIDTGQNDEKIKESIEEKDVVNETVEEMKDNQRILCPIHDLYKEE